MFNRFRSLRWRLQAWYTGILFLVIAGLSSVLHWEITRSQWDQVDEELISAARILDGSMRDVSREILDSMSRDLAAPPGPHFPPRTRNGPPSWPPTFSIPDSRRWLGPPNRMPDTIHPGRDSIGWMNWDLIPEDPRIAGLPRKEWETRIDWPRSIPERLGRHEGPAYFLVWRSDGSLLRQENVPLVRLEALDWSEQETIAKRLERDRYVWHQRGPWREVYISGTRGTLICVGRSVVGEHTRTNRLTGSLFVTGLSILVLGTLGGWWTITRAITPIQKMSDTARGINAHRLSERMDLKGVDSELAELGTVLNHMLDRLGASIDQQKRFTADASHELRTPLSVILSSTELALSKPRSPEEYREHFEKCRRAASRMRNLIESLLTLARVDATPMIETYTRVDLQQIIRDSVQLLEPIATECYVAVSYEVERCFVLGDSNQLGQAFVNLISNAIKYNSVGGTVRIQSKMEGTFVLIEVTDSGPGIPEEDLLHVFERFYRVDQARSRVQGGTGLGLSITERIISAHGGEIGARSKIGVGSTFWVKLKSIQYNPRAA